jgi:neuraminyllactose-binding hemagglutinin
MCYFKYVVLALYAAVLVACANAPQQIIQPDPHFDWEPSSKLRNKNVNLALVSPNFSSHSTFGSYKGNNYLKTYLSAFQTDLQTTLIAKGFSLTGPYDDFDMMTYPNKKASDLAIVPELVFNIDENYSNVYNNAPGASIKRIKMSGNLRLNGFIKFSMVEPISEQKMWIKKINLPEQEEIITVDLVYYIGALDHLHANKDNRDAALVNMLNKIYPEVMKKFWSYLDDEEIKMMVKASKNVRAKKRY